VTALVNHHGDHGSLNLDRIYAPFPTFPAVETAAEGDQPSMITDATSTVRIAGPGGEENRRDSR
jgi:hypothetical protein